MFKTCFDISPNEELSDVSYMFMEVIAIKGNAIILSELADKHIAVKGIRRGKLIMSRAN